MAFLIIYMVMLSLGVTLLMRRGMNINVWWIAFFSTTIYSLPVAFGRDAFNNSAGFEASVMMLIVMLGSLSCAVLSRTEKKSLLLGHAPPSFAERVVPVLFVMASFVSFSLILANYGSKIFFVHKTESGVSGQFYVFWRLTATLAVISCMLTKRKLLLMAALVPLSATLFAGDRTAVGITLISSAWLLLQGKKISPLASGLVVCASLLIGVFLFFGKTFQAQWASGTFTSMPDLVRAVASQGTDAVVRTEPFAVFGVLDALVDLPQHPPGSLLLEVAAQFLIFPSYFGFQSSSFNDFFQPILFPGFRERSMAYSFWGEGYVRGGWLGFTAFLCVYLWVLRLFDKLSQNKSLLIRLASCVGGAYWAFYIHRNSLVSILAYERQIIVFCVSVFFVFVVLRWFNRRVGSISG